MNHEIYQGPGLTNPQGNLYSERRGPENFAKGELPGKSFMDGEQGEGQPASTPKPGTSEIAPAPKTPPEEAKSQEVTPQDLKDLKSYWRRQVEAGKMTPEEAQKVIERKMRPIAGGEAAPDEATKRELERHISYQRQELELEDLQAERRRIAEAMLRRENPVPEEEGQRMLRDLEARTRDFEKRRREELEAEPGHYGQHRLTDVEKAQIIEGEDEAERIFNRMFVRVDARPRDDFRDAFGVAGEIEYNDFITTLIDTLEKAGTDVERQRLDRLITRYSQEKNLREIIHQANYALSANVNTDKFTGFLQTFTSDMADTAYRTDGVTLAAHLYEQALRKVIDENGGYLPAVEAGISFSAPKVTGREGRVEHLARQYLDEAIKTGLLKDENGNVIKAEDFPEWKIRRALSLGRGMGIVTERTLEILSQVKLPKKAHGMPSLYGQDIVRDMVPYRHHLGKFQIGKERLAFLAYATKRGQWAWSQKELLEFKEYVEKTDGGLAEIVNGEDIGLGERYICRVTPFEIGSIFSHTGWRAGAATEYFNDVEKTWIGTGVRLERLRGNLNSTDPEKKGKAETEAKAILRQVAKTQPLKLLRQMTELGRQVEHDRIFEQTFGLGEGELASLREKRKKNTLTETERGILDGIDEAERDLILVQEGAVQKGFESAEKEGKKLEEGDELNFELITDQNRRTRAESLGKAIRNTFLDGDNFREPLNYLFEKIRRDDWPFVLGTDDVPFDKYQFVETGPTGLARMLRDFMAESKAVADLVKIGRHMDSYVKQEQILEDLRAMYENISAYDEDKARRATLEVAEGIIKFYSKDWWARLPLGLGTGLGFLAARGVPLGFLIGKPGARIKSSYAKTAFGNEAMAWNEKAKWDFTCALQAQGMLDYRQVEELRKRVGATRKHLAWYYSRTYTPLGLFAFMAEMWQVFTKDLTKELSTT